MLVCQKQGKRKHPNKCITRFCRNNRYKTRKICPKCQSRLYKERNPLRYHFNITKQAAKQRKKDWSLTFDEYSAFCHKTNYIKLKGKTPTSLTIDRIDPREGYHAWNVRAMTHAENSARQDAAPADYEYDEALHPF